MAISTYKVEVKPGVTKTFFLVQAEGINRYTGKRVQKKRRGITSRVKAERVYRELWNLCLEEHPMGNPISSFGELRECYFNDVEMNTRTELNLGGFSPKVISTKKSRFVHLGSWDQLHLDLFTEYFVTQELDRLEAGGIVSRSLSASIQKEVKCLFNYAVKRGFLKVNPIANLKKRKVPKRKKVALTHEESNLLLREARIQGHPYFFIWLLSLTLGLRRSELAGMKWLDIDFEHRLIHLRRQMQPKEGLVEKLKNNEERTVAIPASVISTMKEYQLKSKSEFVIDIDCKKWIGGNQSQVLREFCRKIGIKEVTHHQLRATYITLSLVDGIPLGIVKESVGHAKLSTTDEYFRSSGIEMRGKTDSLSINVPQEMEAAVTKLRKVK